MYPRGKQVWLVLTLFLLGSVLFSGPAAGMPLSDAARVEELSGENPPAASPGNAPQAKYWVRGRVLYYDRVWDPASQTIGPPVLVPARQVYVEIWEKDTWSKWPLFDEWVTWTRTDNEGYFAVQLSHGYDPDEDDEFYVKAFAQTRGGVVVSCGDRQVYAVRTVPLVSDRHSDVDFGDIVSEFSAPAFNIADVMLEGRNYVESMGQSISSIRAYWGSDCNFDGSLFHTEREWLGDDEHWIELELDDGYADVVILHEFGHWVQTKFSHVGDSGGNHSIGGHYTPEFAWSEGFPTYFAAAALNSPFYTDCPDWTTGASCVPLSWENWPLQGYDNEGVVTSILWDLYDPANEPHDRALGQEHRIWDIFDDWIGFPFVPLSNPDLYGFYEAWEALYNVDAEEAAVFARYDDSYTWPPDWFPLQGSVAGVVPWGDYVWLIDATGSMSEEIAEVRSAVQDFVTLYETWWPLSQNAFEHVVETFTDPPNDNVTVVDDFFSDVINPAVAGITVGGGGSAEEAWPRAMLQATAWRHGFHLTLFTDAYLDPWEYGGLTVEYAQHMMQQRHVQADYVVYPAEENYAGEQRTVQVAPGDQQAGMASCMAAAASSDGQCLFIEAGETMTATKILGLLGQDNAGTGRVRYTTASSSVTYEWDDVGYDWYDASGGSSHSFREFVALTLTQPFTFYNVPYGTVYLARPGYLSFEPPDPWPVSDNTSIPTGTVPNLAIYGFWDNLDSARSSSEDRGLAPAVYSDYDAANNRFVVQYNQIPHQDVPGWETFEIILDFDTGEIVLQYAEVGNDGSVTVGLENADGTVGTQVIHDQPGALYPGRAIQFIPVPAGPQVHEVLVDSTMVSLSVILDDPLDSLNLTLLRPDGTPVDPADPDVSYLQLPSVEYYRVTRPDPGSWTAQVSGDGIYDLKSSSTSALQASYVGDLSLGLGVSGPILVNLGLTLTAQPSFSLVSRDGTVLDTLELYDDGAHGDGLAGDGLYGGTYLPAVGGTFHLQVEGQTAAGEPFRRLAPFPLTFRDMRVQGPPNQTAEPGDVLRYDFVLYNDSEFWRHYDFSLDSSLGWSSIGVYSWTVSPYNHFTIPVTVQVPAVPSASLGLVEQANLVVQHGDMVDSAVVSTLVQGKPAEISLSVTPFVIHAGGDTAEILALVDDALPQQVVDGTVVTFQTSLGTIAPLTATTVNGMVTATLTSGVVTGTAQVLVTAGEITQVVAVEIEVPRPYTISLEAAQSQLVPDGESTTMLTATVLDWYGDPVADGTLVALVMNHDDGMMGSIEGGEIYTATTRAGVVTATYSSGQQPGLAQVRALVPQDDLEDGTEGVSHRIWAMTSIRLTYGYSVYLPVVFNTTAP